MGKTLRDFVGVNAFNERPDGTKISHQEFYSTIVNAIGLDSCMEYVPFSKEELTKAYLEDKHFNTLPIKEWDNMHSVFKHQFLKIGVNTFSLSATVCTLKEASRMYINQKAEVMA